MVHIPDDDEAPQAPQKPQPKPPAPEAKRPVTAESQRPVTSQQSRVKTGPVQVPPDGRVKTAQVQMPPDGRVKTAPVQVPPGSNRPTSQAPGNTQSRQRQTQLMSLEPPRRGIQGAKLKPDARMDSMAGPSTISSRNRSLMGNIGREKTQGLMPG
ncbi:MAG: hypothetical protein IT463_14930, partial [Planctomycetes bacterium]|nr:hypothetical protein [Planctomycetota bacterium]